MGVSEKVMLCRDRTDSIIIADVLKGCSRTLGTVLNAFLRQLFLITLAITEWRTGTRSNVEKSPGLFNRVRIRMCLVNVIARI